MHGTLQLPITLQQRVPTPGALDGAPSYRDRLPTVGRLVWKAQALYKEVMGFLVGRWSSLQIRSYLHNCDCFNQRYLRNQLVQVLMQH